MFAALPKRGRVILAISGGADSMALLWLAAQWRDATKSPVEFIAATVDHGLRVEAKREAKSVAALAKSLRVPHRMLTWRGAKPKTGIEAKSREARYALLGKLAKQEGASHIITAHTLDDQAETVLMRLAAGSGPAGLGGMRANEPTDDFTLSRPLLSVTKARLIATLQKAGIAWSEDPMNRDATYARPRLRAAAAALAAEGMTAERLGKLAERQQRAETAIATLMQALPGPCGVLDSKELVIQPEEVAIRRLMAEIRAACPAKPHRPRLEQVEELWEVLQAAIRERKRLRRTLGDVLIALDAQGRITFAPAPQRRSAAKAEKPGEKPGKKHIRRRAIHQK
nr:tRNA lysidine(34) synthetase TilS [Variibacter gotjawalensis]